MRAPLLRLLAVATLVGVSPAGATRGAVATEHRAAADAGAEILAAGGGAVDAAIAAAAAVCVVHASSCGIGGGGFALVRQGGVEAALDFRETAPRGARPERYVRDGKPDEALLRTGGLAVGVPGEVAGWAALHARFGRLPLARLLAPAVRLARDGFALGETPHLAREIGRMQAFLAADPGLAAVFLAPGGAVPGADFRIVQPALARTLERIGTRGAGVFYRGPVAAAVAATVAARGGVLDAKDLAGYRTRWRTPLVGSFRGRRIVTFPPPGSGGIVLEVLGLLAGDDLPALGDGSPAMLHLLADVFAQAFADRATWYGDPDFTRVPVTALLAPSRLAALRAKMSALAVYRPNAALVADAGTTHLSVVTTDGDAVALTTTINTSFGAGIMVADAGIVLNNEMDDFALAPNTPNAFGLVGKEANAVAPGKRPQSSMSPTIVLRGTRPELVVGGSGGPTIISGTAQALLRVVAFGEDVSTAVAAPRIHAQAPPALAIEPGVPGETRAVLTRIGHQVRELPMLGAVTGAGVTRDGQPVAAGDARKDGGSAVTRPPSP